MSRPKALTGENIESLITEVSTRCHNMKGAIKSYKIIREENDATIAALTEENTRVKDDLIAAHAERHDWRERAVTAEERGDWQSIRRELDQEKSVRCQWQQRANDAELENTTLHAANETMKKQRRALQSTIDETRDQRDSALAVVATQGGVISKLTCKSRYLHAVNRVLNAEAGQLGVYIHSAIASGMKVEVSEVWLDELGKGYGAPQEPDFGKFGDGEGNLSMMHFQFRGKKWAVCGFYDKPTVLLRARLANGKLGERWALIPDCPLADEFVKMTS